MQQFTSYDSDMNSCKWNHGYEVLVELLVRQWPLNLSVFEMGWESWWMERPKKLREQAKSFWQQKSHLSKEHFCKELICRWRYGISSAFWSFGFSYVGDVWVVQLMPRSESLASDNHLTSSCSLAMCSAAVGPGYYVQALDGILVSTVHEFSEYRDCDGPLWAFRLGAGRDSDCRVQPRQIDAVDRRTRSKRL